MSTYQPVPVDVARTIGQAYAKQIVVIVSLDGVHQLTHFTSWGESAEEKAMSAELCDQIARITGHCLQAKLPFEDYRFRPQAESAAIIDGLKKQLRGRTVSLAEKQAWSDRHDLGLTGADLVAAFDDAATLYGAPDVEVVL